MKFLLTKFFIFSLLLFLFKAEPFQAAVSPSTGVVQESVPRAPFKVVQLTKGLTIPWQLAFAPGGRIFITERPGTVRLFQNEKLAPLPWLTLRETAAVGEGGLLGIALHPQFPNPPYVYLAYNYAEVKNGVSRRFNRLARYRDEKGRAVFDRILIDKIPAGSHHNGGRLRFSPQGKLFWAVGDRYKSGEAQQMKPLTGKILRLTPAGAIPKDNPFPNSYVYSYGHRNVQGLAFHPLTQTLYATEHGPSGWRDCCLDEVNLITSGANYGWPLIRGSQKKPGLEPPLLHSGKQITWAPAGAAFVPVDFSGPWKNSLLFVGLRSQTLFRLILAPPRYERPLRLEKYLTGQLGRLREVAISPFDGNIYLLNNNRGAGEDALFRLVFTP